MCQALCWIFDTKVKRHICSIKVGSSPSEERNMNKLSESNKMTTVMDKQESMGSKFCNIALVQDMLGAELS